MRYVLRLDKGYTLVPDASSTIANNDKQTNKHHAPFFIFIYFFKNKERSLVIAKCALKLAKTQRRTSTNLNTIRTIHWIVWKCFFKIAAPTDGDHPIAAFNYLSILAPRNHAWMSLEKFRTMFAKHRISQSSRGRRTRVDPIMRHEKCRE